MTSSPTDNDGGDNDQVRSKSDFSIDHILNRAGNSASDRKPFESPVMVPFPWLQCSRYCPPKIPRNSKREGPQKRQLGRHPRIPFTSQQLSVLEDKFHQTPYLSSTEVTKISKSLQLADIRVKIWFQNRRARERRERAQLETQKLLTTSNNSQTVPQEYGNPSETSVLIKPENILSSENVNSVTNSPCMLPLLPKYPSYDDVRNAHILLNYSSSLVNDDSN